MPRIRRAEAERLVEQLGGLEVEQIASRLPVDGSMFRYAELGGLPAERQFLTALRDRVVALASEHGYPERRPSGNEFDVRCGALLHAQLDITPNEAAQDEVWCGLTAGHLLDVAIWRWDGVGDVRRFNGDLNRDTFRRLWWRSEYFRDPASGEVIELLEDEYVAVMERAFVTGDPRTARAIARGFLSVIGEKPEVRRTLLLRETMKRFTRLSPFLAFDAINDEALAECVSGEIRAAAAALTPETTAPASTSSSASQDGAKTMRGRSGGLVGGVRRAVGRGRSPDS